MTKPIFQIVSRLSESLGEMNQWAVQIIQLFDAARWPGSSNAYSGALAGNYRYCRLVCRDHESKIAVTKPISFSSDGNRMTVQGVKLMRILQFSQACKDAVNLPHNWLRDFVDTTLTAAAWISRRCPEDVFVEWLELISEKIVSKHENFPNSSQVMEAYIQEYEQSNFPFEDSFFRFMVNCFHSSKLSFCLLENGNVQRCLYPRQVGNSDDEIWLLQGCDILLILSPTAAGYLYRGNIDHTQLGLPPLNCSEGFFSILKIQAITLI